MSLPAMLFFQPEGINWMKDFKVMNAALTVNPLNKTPEWVKPSTTPSSTPTEFPFLLYLHTCVTMERKKVMIIVIVCLLYILENLQFR